MKLAGILWLPLGLAMGFAAFAPVVPTAAAPNTDAAAPAGPAHSQDQSLEIRHDPRNSLHRACAYAVLAEARFRADHSSAAAGN